MHTKTSTRLLQCVRTTFFENWTCTGQCSGMNFTLLCCPEDKRCAKRCPSNTLCPACETPICATCWDAIALNGKLPPEALSNDMMVFYGPNEIYESQVTFMEMLCASPCVTTLMCFSLEKRYRMHRTWDENAWMNDYRLAARGNATTFPLAWENLVEQLQSIGDIKSPNLLPRTGHQLAEVVRVLIKSNAAEKETAERPDTHFASSHRTKTRCSYLNPNCCQSQPSSLPAPRHGTSTNESLGIARKRHTPRNHINTATRQRPRQFTTTKKCHSGARKHVPIASSFRTRTLAKAKCGGM